MNSKTPPETPAQSSGIVAGYDARAIGEYAERAARFMDLEIATDGFGPGLPPSVPTLVDTRTGSLLSLKTEIERFRIVPERKKGTAQVQTLESFIELVNRHKTGHSAIFSNLDWAKPLFSAVIDYHENKPAGGADWLNHRIVYQFPLSEEWKAWSGQNGKTMSQGDFAAFIEDHIAELASPTEAEKIELERRFQTTIATPNELMILSRGLQVFVAAQVKNTTTLQSGEGEVVFVEEHQNAQGEKIKVPGLFLLNISPFFQGEEVRLPVRLRYRAGGGKLTWFYQVWRADLLITERLQNDAALVAEETGLPVYAGTPEAQGPA
jgi:uncharacterized protein YfdQ (DUF2303 family)